MARPTSFTPEQDLLILAAAGKHGATAMLATKMNCKAKALHNRRYILMKKLAVKPAPASVSKKAVKPKVKPVLYGRVGTIRQLARDPKVSKTDALKTLKVSRETLNAELKKRNIKWNDKKVKYGRPATR